MPHAHQLSVWPLPHGEECFGHLLVGGRSGTEVKASYDSHRVDSHKETEAFVPSQAIAPSNVGAADQPSTTPALCISDGHSRAVQCFIGTSLSLHQLRQVQRHLISMTSR
jgi:hypothetical protein